MKTQIQPATGREQDRTPWSRALATCQHLPEYQALKAEERRLWGIASSADKGILPAYRAWGGAAERVSDFVMARLA